MNFIYCISDHNLWPATKIFLHSLQKSDEDFTLLFCGCHVFEEWVRAIYKKPMFFYPVHNQMWSGRIATCKIEFLKKLSDQHVKESDSILCLDTDIIVKGNLFDVMGNDGMYVTTRYYPHRKPVNGGVFGFKGFPGKSAINFYYEQIHAKSWEPYKKYLVDENTIHRIDWCIGQDFLNIAFTHGINNCPIFDLGSCYNFCPDYGSRNYLSDFLAAKKLLEEKLMHPSIKVLHYKGALKECMEEHAKKLNIL
jgi:hypothetical protein